MKLLYFRPVFFLLLLFLVLLCTGCRNKEVLFLSDHFFVEAGYLGRRQLPEVRKRVGELGYDFKVEQISLDAATAAAVSSILDQSRAEIVLFSPLLAGSMAEAYAVAPGKFYVQMVFEEQAGESPFPRVVFTRLPAFAELGRALCTAVSGGEAAADGGPKVAGVWYTGSEERREERDAFLEAFKEQCSLSLVEIEEVKTFSNENEVRNIFEDTEWKKLEIGLSFASLQNGVVINEFVNDEISFASENLLPSDEFRFPRTVYSIEYPLIEAIVLAVRMKTTGKQRVVLAAKVVKIEK